jgi:hypothetical protein
MSISVTGSCASGTTFRNSPVMTGESTSVVREAGAKWISFPLWLAMGRAVPNFHPSGSFRAAL